MGEVEFSFKIFFFCIIYDIVDTISDYAEQGSSSIGLGSGIIEAGFDTLDIFQWVSGAILFYLMSAPMMMQVVALGEPAFDEGIPLPMYTIMYIGLVLFDMDSLDRAKGAVGARRGRQ